MKRAFEHFAAWRLESPTRRAVPRASAADAQAHQRWDGEGGNIGPPPQRTKRERARQLARMRQALRMRASVPTRAQWPSTIGGYAKQAP